MNYAYRVKDAGSGDVLTYYNESSSLIPIDLIKSELSKSLLRPRFRLYWLNDDETIWDILPEEDILDGTYNENYQNGQRRNLSITLINETGKYTPSINGLWTNIKFSFEMGLELEDSSVIWFPKGIYTISSISTSHGAGEKTVSIELNDKFSILEGKAGTFETSYLIDVGNEIESVIDDILKYNKGDGSVIDPKAFIYDSSFKGKKIEAPISKEAGSNFGEILLEIATQLSAEVFYDVEGHLNFVPINYVSDDIDKPIIYQIYDYAGDFNDNNLSFDLNSIINRIVVIGSTVDGGICQAVAVNDDPSSPLCYQRIGYRTESPINDTNITNEVLAQERANYELRNKLILKASASITTMFNPLLLVNNFIGITDEFYGFKQELFLIQSISTNLNSPTFSVSCTNAKNIPFVVSRR